MPDPGPPPGAAPPAGPPPGDPSAPGPARTAPSLRRVLALVIDWALCSAISAAFFGYAPMATLAVFALENLVLVAWTGNTIGHRLAGLRVVRADDPRRPVGLGRAAVRSALLCLVIPAAVWDAEGRGMHDRAAGTRISVPASPAGRPARGGGPRP